MRCHEALVNTFQRFYSTYSTMTIGNVKMRNISHMLFVSEASRRQLNQLVPFKEAINRQGALLS